MDSGLWVAKPVLTPAFQTSFPNKSLLSKSFGGWSGKSQIFPKLYKEVRYCIAAHLNQSNKFVSPNELFFPDIASLLSCCLGQLDVHSENWRARWRENFLAKI